MSFPDTNSKESESFFSKWFGKYPGRTLQRIGTALFGFWIANSSIDSIWPKPDQIAAYKSVGIQLSNKESLPNEPIMIYIVGMNLKHDRKSKSLGKNSDLKEVNSIILVKSDKKEPLEIIQVPIEAKVNLTSLKTPKSLASIYKEGGLAFFSDYVEEILNPKEILKERYVIFSAKALISLVENIGGLAIDFDDSYLQEFQSNPNYKDPSTRSGRLNGAEVRSLFISSMKNANRKKIRERRELIIKGIGNRFKTLKNEERVSLIARDLLNNTQTNLTHEELMTLLMIYKNDLDPPIYRKINIP